MLARAFAAEVPAAWVTGDEIYGDDGALRRWLEAGHHPYVLAVSAHHPVWQQRCARASGPAHRGRAARGVGAAVGRDGEPGRAALRLGLPPGALRERARRRATGCWHGARCSDPTALAYYRVFAPAATPVATMVRVAGMRWAIEASFEDAKGVVGLDHYEVRKWTAWYRHVTLALLADAYLEVTGRAGHRRAKGGTERLIPLTVPEVRRLLLTLTESTRTRRSGRLAWSSLSAPAPGGGRALPCGAAGAPAARPAGHAHGPGPRRARPRPDRCTMGTRCAAAPATEGPRRVGPPMTIALGRVCKMGYPLPDGTTRTERGAMGAAGAVASAAAAVRSRAPQQGPPDDRQRHPVAAGHGRAMAGPAGAVRSLAHGVLPLPPLAARRGLGASAGGAPAAGRHGG